MSRPKVSVIIPTYNRLEFLKESVASVLGQTFTNYELIISDNCSEGGTNRWASSLTKKNSKVRYYRNEENLGMVRNWNKGLSRSRGEYVSILMDDDLWEPNFLAETVKILDKKDNVGLVCVHIVPLCSTSSKKKEYPENLYKLHSHSREVKGIECIRQFLDSVWLVGLPSGILVRKKCFEELGQFDEICLDPEMWLRICSKYDFYYLDKKLCHWRIHDSEGFTSTNVDMVYKIYRKFRILDKAFAYSYIRDDLKEVFSLKKKAYKQNRMKLLCLLPRSLISKDINLAEIISLYRLYASLWMFLPDVFSIAKSKIVKAFGRLLSILKV